MLAQYRITGNSQIRPLAPGEPRRRARLSLDGGPPALYTYRAAQGSTFIQREDYVLWRDWLARFAYHRPFAELARVQEFAPGAPFYDLLALPGYEAALGTAACQRLNADFHSHLRESFQLANRGFLVIPNLVDPTGALLAKLAVDPLTYPHRDLLLAPYFSCDFWGWGYIKLFRIFELAADGGAVRLRTAWGIKSAGT